MFTNINITCSYVIKCPSVEGIFTCIINSTVFTCIILMFSENVISFAQ